MSAFPVSVSVGLVSDTHGLLRPEAVEALRGVSRILHAGDVGNAYVLRALGELAPVTAVRGNTDGGDWARLLPSAEVVDLGGLLVGLVHDLAAWELDPRAAGLGVVVSGHTHRPVVERRGDLLFVNPGSAGPRRFSLPVTVARLSLCAGHASAEIVYLNS